MFDESLNALPTRKLQRLTKSFDPWTEEWQKIQAIILYRKWLNLYGQKTATEMVEQWINFGVPVDQDTGEQIDLFV